MNIKVNDIQTFLDALAGPSAAPGGGGAAALSGAMSAALISMVCNLTIGRPRFAEVEAILQEALARAEALRQQLTELVEADGRAFNQVMAAYGQPKETEPEREARQAAIQAALRQATQTPLETVMACATVIRLAGRVVDKINPNTLGDAAAAVRLAEGGLRVAQMNIAINLAGVHDPSFEEEIQLELNKALAGLTQTREDIFAYILTHSNALATIVNIERI